MTIEARPRGAEKTRRRPGRGASRLREAPSRPDDFLVVGLGASAGGLEALNKLFDALPPDTGMAFVLIQHLDPTHKSMMVGLLAGHTSMKVLEAAEDMPIERDHVYVMPPGVYLSICEGAFRLTQPRERHGARACPSISFCVRLPKIAANEPSARFYRAAAAMAASG